MRTDSKIVRLEDYTAPPYFIPKINLHFDLKEEESLVTAHMTVIRNEKSLGKKELFLDGINLDLIEIKRNGLDMKSEDYQIDSRGLFLKNCPEQFELKTKVRLKPQDNKAFSGLYKTQKVFCTQMEAQGFRRTTFFMDRPDVLSQYETTIVADKDRYPILLSNGNLISTKILEEGRHCACWKDPFPKPCYLFALVAGDLDWLEDSYKTLSGRHVTLKIFVNKGQRERTHHAMKSLKEAMKWDEQTFNLEYDLNIYNIVAVDDFNMGAMENKSLNIFNSKFVLANSQTVTDEEFVNIQRVIGHEYFHNWSGNRVTCRDWFQLSLKEGLTVFRDQEFSSDMNSRAVKRIEDVMKLRNLQFPEDSGPMAHPVRPSSYIAIDNFYTVTVYEKGAEVIRMLKTLLGDDLFKKGVARYFELFDGQAVTTDHWVEVMEQVSGRNLSQFKLWYEQAGTPQIFVQTQYHRERKVFEIKLSQETKNPLTGEDQKPFHIPLKTGLISKRGQPLAFVQEKNPLVESGEKDFSTGSVHKKVSTEGFLELIRTEQVFYLSEVMEEPVLSLNRQFSAPVRLKHDLDKQDLVLLMKKDRDSFNRWESAQRIYHRQLTENYLKLLKGEQAEVLPFVSEVLSDMILDRDKDPALLAKTLCLPQVQFLGQSLSDIDPQILKKSYDCFYKTVSAQLHEVLLKEYEELQVKKLGNSFQDVALRSYKNRLLHLLYRHDELQGASLFYKHFKEAENMTDSLFGLHRLGVHGGKLYDRAMDEFFEKWQKDSLVVNKWLSVTALSDSGDCFKKIREKAQSSAFNKTNPNNLFSLFYCFAHFNWFQFHSKTGETYQWFVDQVLDVDNRNPQVSARLGSCLNNWRSFHGDYQKHIRKALEKILDNSPTDNLFEIANKALEKK